MTNSTDSHSDVAELLLGSWSDDARARIAEHLTEIGEVDLAEPDYSFDLLRFYVRKHDGMVLYATDSGCSCPSPFEDVRVADLKETTLAGVLDVARREASDDDRYSSRRAVDIVDDVRKMLPAMREAGAK